VGAVGAEEYIFHFTTKCSVKKGCVKNQQQSSSFAGKVDVNKTFSKNLLSQKGLNFNSSMLQVV